MNRFLECCSTSVQEVLDAQRLGASRIELCEDLPVGGVTPSRKLLESVLSVARIPVNVLVRPRGGDFHFNEREVEEMLASIGLCKELGVNAVVIGALDAEGHVDIQTMKRLISAARPLPVTFHRAFDVCADPDEAFGQIMELGCERLLSSGHEPDAFSGRHYLAKLVKRAAEYNISANTCAYESKVPGSNSQELETQRFSTSESKIQNSSITNKGSHLIVMPGCGVRPSNIDEIASVTGASEFHASFSFFKAERR